MMVSDRPLLVSWTVTERCNLACAHCYNQRRDQTEPDANLVRLIVDRLIESEVLSVTLTGGEPLLRQDLVELVEGLARAGLAVEINSNGLALTPELAARLRDAGAVGIRISLDGPDASSHDRLRGVPGAFAAAISAIEMVARVGLIASVATVPMTTNIDHLDRIVSLATAAGSVRHYFFRFVPTRGQEHAYLALPATDYMRIMSDLCQNNPHINWEEPCQARLWDIGSFGCAAGTTYVGIDLQGRVVPCPSLPIPVGDLRAQSLLDLWHSPLLLRFRNRDYESCRPCPKRFQCGGCRSAAWARDGDCLASDPYCEELGGIMHAAL